jgi:hypothetical protein
LDAGHLHPEFAAFYTQACEKRVEAMENDLLEIADDTDRDYREGKNGKDIPNKEQMLRSKIRIESRQWLMSRRDPKQWSDKQSVDVSANIMLLSPEERVLKALALFDLMEKFVERARNPVGAVPSPTIPATTIFRSLKCLETAVSAKNDRCPDIVLVPTQRAIFVPRSSALCHAAMQQLAALDRHPSGAELSAIDRGT